MLIFDRDRADHPWRRALEDLSTSDEPSYRILAENWCIDPRVSEDREIAMLETGDCGPIPAGAEWLAGRNAHFERHICRPAMADATGPGSETLRTFNHANLLAPVPGYEQIVHVKSLNGVLWRLAEPGYVSDDQREEFEELTGYPVPSRSPADFAARVDAIVTESQKRRVGSVRALAGFLCQALGSTQPLWWACFAEEVKKLIANGDAAGLCKALGLGHFREGDWLIVWRYDARWTRSSYRPTVVEAGASRFYHPSPPGARFGATIALDTSLPTCREFLHPPLGGRLAVESCTGELLRVEGLEEIDETQLIATASVANRPRCELKSGSIATSPRHDRGKNTISSSAGTIDGSRSGERCCAPW